MILKKSWNYFLFFFLWIIIFDIIVNNFIKKKKKKKVYGFNQFFIKFKKLLYSLYMYIYIFIYIFLFNYVTFYIFNHYINVILPNIHFFFWSTKLIINN